MPKLVATPDVERRFLSSTGPLYVCSTGRQRLPADAIVIADSNFRIFAFADAVHEAGAG